MFSKISCKLPAKCDDNLKKSRDFFFGCDDKFSVSFIYT